MSRTPTYFRVSPKVLGPLGAEQLQDPALAVLELIKNSWDADATKVWVSIQSSRTKGEIRVRDNGRGMTRDQFVERWLVIGASGKRSSRVSAGGRHVIGEKGLGRLSSFALGSNLSIRSSNEGEDGFSAFVDWEELIEAESLDQYAVDVIDQKSRPGTEVVVSKLRRPWSSENTNFLVTHAEFLAASGQDSMKISLKVNGRTKPLQDPQRTIESLAEAEIAVMIADDGTPLVVECTVDQQDMSDSVFRDLGAAALSPNLGGAEVRLKFFRRDLAPKRLAGVLARNEVNEVLERYQGVRIFMDGINVPPYGLAGDDWAALEKQRTATGGPTLVPGNSQLIGEVHLSRKDHPQFVITAGRSGFSDQALLSSLAEYVRWSVKQLGVARRARHLGIEPGEKVPGRIDEPGAKSKGEPVAAARRALSTLGKHEEVARSQELLALVRDTVRVVQETLNENAETLRLYAQLASTGIAATSFAHELRTDFDVVADAVDEIVTDVSEIDDELIGLLNSSWQRIEAFAALFKVVPVKLRRRKSRLTTMRLRQSVSAILAMAPTSDVETKLTVPSGLAISLVPAELDSILLNLVSNAVKAISESDQRGAGKIRIELKAQGTDLWVSVADNGCGVTDKVAEIMFEPLEGKFSEGTGMGLPIAQYIAQRYGGFVRWSREVPSGYTTVFEFVLRKVVDA